MKVKLQNATSKAVPVKAQILQTRSAKPLVKTKALKLRMSIFN